MIVLAALSGCLLFPRAAPDPRAQALAAADMRFRERGQDPGALDMATAAWTVLLDGSARDAPIHARLAQAAWIRGRASAADPQSARVYFELAEERGWACAMATPGFAVRMRRAAGRPSAEALAGVDPVDAPCLAWAAAGMVEVLALRGPGASLDLATLDALRGYLQAHPAAPAAPWEPEGLPGFDDWLDARRALLADDALARQAARGDFDRAVAAAPDFLPWQRDRAQAFPGQDTAAAPPEGETRWPLENRDARTTWTAVAP